MRHIQFELLKSAVAKYNDLEHEKDGIDVMQKEISQTVSELYDKYGDLTEEQKKELKRDFCIKLNNYTL